MAGRAPSRNDPIYEATMQHLMYEQEILKIEFERLNENNQDTIYIKNHLDELLKYIDEVEDEDFREDIFRKTVVKKGCEVVNFYYVIYKKGILFNNHRVEVHFKCGITCTIWVKHKKKAK